MSWIGRPASVRAILAAVLGCASCQHRPLADPATASPTFDVGVRLSDLAAARPRTVRLWVSTPHAGRGRPLVLHLTGDGGAHGLDLLLFTALTRWGFPVALLSSPSWAGTLVGGRTTPDALALDLDRMARAAAAAAETPAEAPFVILGLSRGAGLAVEAAGEAPLRGRLAGVVALGLCGREEYVWRGRSSGRPYVDKDRLGDLPLEVLQSTRDRYMTVAAARQGFGLDTAARRLHAIEAQSHTFVDGREALLEQLERSLDRIAPATASAATTPSAHRDRLRP